MPVIPRVEAVERLARAAEAASSDELVEIQTELFPGNDFPPTGLPAPDLARHIRTGLEPEDVVDLWNVVFPHDWNVYYDEEDDALKYNEREMRYAEQ